MRPRRIRPVGVSRRPRGTTTIARMDEAGTPFGLTVDGETAGSRTVTVRHRDSMQQERVSLDRLAEYLAQRL